MVSGTAAMLQESEALSKEVYVTMQCFVLGALTTHTDIRKPGPGQSLRDKMSDVLVMLGQGAVVLPDKYKGIVQTANDVLAAHPSSTGKKHKAQEEATDAVCDASSRSAARVLRQSHRANGDMGLVSGTQGPGTKEVSGQVFPGAA